MSKSELPKLKIAVASNGLGQIRRGVETWAEDRGAALHRRGVDVTTLRGRDSSAREWEKAVLRGALATQYELLSDPAVRSKMARAAPGQAENLFSEDVVVNQVLEMDPTVAGAA